MIRCFQVQNNKHPHLKCILCEIKVLNRKVEYHMAMLLTGTDQNLLN